MSMNNNGKGGVLVPLQIGLPEQTQLHPAVFMRKMRLVIHGDGTPENLPNSQVKAIIEQRDLLYKKALAAKVWDETTLEESKATVNKLKELKKGLVNGFNETRDFYHAIHKEVLSIQNEIAADIDKAAKHLADSISRYETEKCRLVQVENERKAAEAAALKRKILKEAEAVKTPEAKAQKQFIAETIVPYVEVIPQTKWKKEIQLIDRAKFLSRALMIPGMDKHISISKTGMNRLADDYFDLEKTTFVDDETHPEWRQSLLGGAAVIIASKM